MLTTTLTPSRLEDYLLAFLPFLTAASGINWPSIIPGSTGFLAGVAIAALAKALISLGQNPEWSKWDDVALFAFVLLGLIGTGLTANPQYLTYGTIIGFIAKAANVFKSGFNIEDAILFVGALIALYGAYTGNPTTTNAGLAIGTLGKALPSLATTTPAATTPSA